MHERPLVDVESGVRYLDCSRSFYLESLRQFERDENIARLERTLRCGEISEAFAAVHALKGISGQLGLIPLSRAAGSLCELLRAQRPECLPVARAQLSSVQRTHAQTLAEIDRLLHAEETGDPRKHFTA